MQNLTPYILLLPLIGFVVLGLFGRHLSKGLISLVGCGTILAAFAFAVVDFIALLGHSGASSSVAPWTWVVSGALKIPFGLLSDPLSAVMLLIVTGVGFLIHLYSVGYMADDPGYWRFFSFLNFFVFAMALLVAADNFLFLLVGWAGVGLASFLLIGFWYTRPSAVAAAKKAFVVNVIGDFGLMLAIFLLFKTFGTLDYFGPNGILNRQILVSSTAPSQIGPGPYPTIVSGTVLTAITLLLLVAAVAKSAQLPLHVWLPDAMEGPTPVSALIHAATMVTAGVYLVARAASLFTAAPNALEIVGIVGAASALFAATLACAQNDIKRILAYSTMSQLAYMFMGEAAGGFSAGIFHLTTHAYFKALLFMSAGAVIHALGGQQDIRKMGGLRGKLRFTFVCFLLGGLALAAIVPLSGFWSKDAILGALLARTTAAGASPLWLIIYLAGLLTALLTGFYTFRLIFGVFFGAYRGGEITAHAEEHGAAAVTSRPRANGRGAGRRDPLAAVHDVGPSMTIPMAILAVLSIIGGVYGLPWNNLLAEFLAPVVPTGPELSGSLAWLNDGLSLAAAVLGIVIAWLGYGRRQHTFVPSRNPIVNLLEHRYYVDDLYDAVFVRPIVALGTGLRRGVEGIALDGGGRGVGDFLSWTSSRLRALQTGYARNYALAIFVGAALIVLYYVIRP
jgi:NADH-quinone oxidoreductase subunit L